MDNIDVLITQYKNIDNMLCSINDKLLSISTDTAINKNDILTLKQDVASLKLTQAALGNELNEINISMKDASNEIPIEKSKKWDKLISLIVKSILPYIIALIIAGITLKIGAIKC